MKAEEKWARELRSFFASEGIDYGPSVSEYFLLRLARHVLRRERAAARRERGKTIGWVILKPECDESGEDCYWEIKGGLLDEPVNVRMTRLMGNEVARVVAVPRKGGRR